jgi:hypothetical protein
MRRAPYFCGTIGLSRSRLSGLGIVLTLAANKEERHLPYLSRSADEGQDRIGLLRVGQPPGHGSRAFCKDCANTATSWPPSILWRPGDAQASRVQAGAGVRLPIQGVNALVVADDAVFTAHRAPIAAVALKNRLPTA